VGYKFDGEFFISFSIEILIFSLDTVYVLKAIGGLMGQKDVRGAVQLDNEATRDWIWLAGEYSKCELQDINLFSLHLAMCQCLSSSIGCICVMPYVLYLFITNQIECRVNALQPQPLQKTISTS